MQASGEIIMKAFVLALLLALFAATSAHAQVARPSDKSVVDLIKKTQSAVKDFERNLDSKVASGTIRGATAEVNVKNYMKDFDTDLDRLSERFKSDYSASAEVVTVMQKAEGINKFIESQPASLKGRSEWDVVTASLKELAAAYGTTFPVPADAPPRRINDKEIIQAADNLSKQAQSYKKQLKDGFTKEESAQLQAAQKSADELSAAAKTLKSRVSSGKPASGEAGVVAEKYAAAQAAIAGRTLSDKAQSEWKVLSSSAGKIEQAFEPAKSAVANSVD
jgi:hypothetical protein